MEDKIRFEHLSLALKLGIVGGIISLVAFALGFVAGFLGFGV